MAVFMHPIYTQTVGFGGSNVVFNNIPQGFDDLLITVSGRGLSAETTNQLYMQFNGVGAVGTYGLTRLRGTGSTAFSERSFGSSGDFFYAGEISNAGSTASTFGSANIYIPNYSSGNFKQALVNIVAENNATFSALTNSAGLIRINNPITSILLGAFGTFAQNSTITVYGISASYDTANPIAPTIGTVIDQAGFLSVPFTPASNDRAKTYSVTTSPASTTVFGNFSPISVPVSLNTAYTAQVSAGNSLGSSPSAASNSITTSNSFASIATSSVGSGGAASIVFTNIPQNYKHLQIRYIARDSRTPQTASSVTAQFNSDGSGTYSWNETTNSNTAISYSAASGQTAISFGRIASISAPSNIFGSCVADILDYSNANKYKSVRYLSGSQTGSAEGTTYFVSGVWNNNSPITSITLLPTTANFLQYSHFALYGVS